MRFFEKISYERFKNDVFENIELYNNYNIPARQTVNSAGYDFESIIDFELKPGEIKKIPTGIKACMNSDEVLMLFVRSSMGFKYNIRMCNQTGIIDSDYYNNPDNEGHIWIALQNEGDKVYKVNKGDRIAQGIFIKFLTVDKEKLIEKNRTSGIGSTNN